MLEDLVMGALSCFSYQRQKMRSKRMRWAEVEHATEQDMPSQSEDAATKHCATSLGHESTRDMGDRAMSMLAIMSNVNVGTGQCGHLRLLCLIQLLL